MADPTHARLIRDGAFIWNAFRRSTRKVQPDLSGADLRGLDLSNTNLSRANLAAAQLEGSNLKGADLTGSTLIGACLNGADLEGADLGEADLSRASLEGACFKGASLIEARLVEADIKSANLDGAVIRDAIFEDAMEVDLTATTAARTSAEDAVVLCEVPLESVEAAGRLMHTLWDFMGQAGFVAAGDLTRPRERVCAVFHPAPGADPDRLHQACEALDAYLSRDSQGALLSRKNPAGLASAIHNLESVALVISDYLVVKVSVLGDRHLRSGFLTDQLRAEIEANPSMLADPATLLRRFARQKPLLSDGGRSMDGTAEGQA